MQRIRRHLDRLVKLLLIGIIASSLIDAFWPTHAAFLISLAMLLGVLVLVFWDGLLLQRQMRVWREQRDRITATLENMEMIERSDLSPSEKGQALDYLYDQYKTGEQEERREREEH